MVAQLRRACGPWETAGCSSLPGVNEASDASGHCVLMAETMTVGHGERTCSNIPVETLSSGYHRG